MSAIPSIPTILNVDDHDVCRYAITRILEHSNFRVKEASNGAEALRIARDDKPDLVLLDINLPDIDGFEVCKRLKAEPDTARIPVLHISASYATSADMARGLESGADSYLMEPVEPEVLIATINAMLRAKRAEEAAREMALEWQATFDAIEDGVAVVDAEGHIQRSNSSLASLLGFTTAELRGQVCYKLWPDPEAGEAPFFLAQQRRRRESSEFTFKERLLRASVDPMFDEAANLTGAVYIVSDITETRRLEEQFRESQKLETVGTLAAGVAHDFNNLLTSIMGNASLAIADQPASSDTRERLQEVIRASQRAADLTKQLLAYSGKGRHFLQKAELSRLVLEMQKLIEAAVPKKVQLELQLPSGLPPIEADLNQIQQALLNLVSNAAEAIGDETGSIAILTGTDTGHEVFLEVRDSGCGMNTETKARIFDPFYTTKFTGRGLGLAAVAGIARGHHAEIQVTSAPGKGSTFRLIFPAAVEASVHEMAVDDATGGATVLVADDEDMVRRIAQATLEIRGFQVLLAHNGLEAIRKVKKHAEIGLVLLDLTMPVMNGEEAFDEIVAAHPGIKIIVSSGYDQREASARFARKQVASFLQKPYTSRQLADKVLSVLGPKAARRVGP